MKAGQIYTVAFWAKVPEGKTKSIGVKFEQLETWTGPSQNMIIDSPEWKEYFFSPNMTMSSPPSVVIHIQFNNETGELWLDHFRVYQGEYEEEEGIGEESTGGMAVQARDKLATVWARMK